MPNYVDFSKLNNIKEIKINPNGWINPLTIEYGIGEQIGPTCFWRVKGTKHTFVIPVLRLNYISSGNYDEHFNEVLEKFATIEYKKWKDDGFSTKWMQEYKNDYERYIL